MTCYGAPPDDGPDIRRKDRAGTIGSRRNLGCLATPRRRCQDIPGWVRKSGRRPLRDCRCCRAGVDDRPRQQLDNQNCSVGLRVLASTGLGCLAKRLMRIASTLRYSQTITSTRAAASGTEPARAVVSNSPQRAESDAAPIVALHAFRAWLAWCSAAV